MQKVVGSSPIIRSRKAPLDGVFCCLVSQRDESQLAALHKGQFVRLRCDPRSNPYVCVMR